MNGERTCKLALFILLSIINVGHAYYSPNAAPPSSEYCEEQGGMESLLTEKEGDEYSQYVSSVTILHVTVTPGRISEAIVAMDPWQSFQSFVVTREENWSIGRLIGER